MASRGDCSFTKADSALQRPRAGLGGDGHQGYFRGSESRRDGGMEEGGREGKEGEIEIDREGREEVRERERERVQGRKVKRVSGSLSMCYILHG